MQWPDGKMMFVSRNDASERFPLLVVNFLEDHLELTSSTKGQMGKFIRIKLSFTIFGIII